MGLYGRRVRCHRRGEIAHGPDPEATRESQTYWLPRLIPVSFSLLALGHELFGAMAGARIIHGGGRDAVRSCAGLAGPRSRPAHGGGHGLCHGLWPDHIYFSQLDRFYIIAFVFSMIVLIAGNRLTRATAPVVGVFLLAGLALVASHTLTIVLFAGGIVAMLASRYASKRPLWDPSFQDHDPGAIPIFFVEHWALLGIGSRWNKNRVHGVTRRSTACWRLSTPWAGQRPCSPAPASSPGPAIESDAATGSRWPRSAFVILVLPS